LTLLPRVAAVIVGLVGLVASASVFVREAVLAIDPSVVWPSVRWWSEIATEPAWQTGLAAGACAILTIVFVILAVRQVVPRRSPGSVQLVEEGGLARLDVGALEPALRRRLQADLRGVKTRRVILSRSGDGWRARVEADLPLRDLAGIQRRAAEILAADLLRVGGLPLKAVDVVATGVAFEPNAGQQ
jgi:hypothetical protein